jgi:uncharacterized protein involved in exopolysaccharide biosynthesis
MAKYIEILFRFKGRFAVLLVVLPAIAGAVTILLFPSYKATGQLWVDNPSYFGGVTPTGWNQYLTPAQNEADSLTQVLTTGAYGRELYRRLATSIPDPAERQQVVAAAKVNVYSTGSHLIAVTGSCSRPSICVLVVNTAIGVLRDQQLDTEKAQAKAGVTFLTAQLQLTRTSLSASEDALRRYIATHPGAKVDGDPLLIPDPELSRVAVDVQNQRGRLSDLQEQLNRDNNILTASTALIQSGPRVVDPPQVVGGRLGDGSTLRKAMMAGAGTLVIGLAYLFVLGWLDKALRDTREIEHRFKVPVVAAIPELSLAERL